MQDSSLTNSSRSETLSLRGLSLYAIVDDGESAFSWVFPPVGSSNVTFL